MSNLSSTGSLPFTLSLGFYSLSATESLRVLLSFFRAKTSTTWQSHPNFQRSSLRGRVTHWKVGVQVGRDAGMGENYREKSEAIQSRTKIAVIVQHIHQQDCILLQISKSCGWKLLNKVDFPFLGGLLSFLFLFFYLQLIHISWKLSPEIFLNYSRYSENHHLPVSDQSNQTFLVSQLCFVKGLNIYINRISKDLFFLLLRISIGRTHNLDPFLRNFGLSHQSQHGFGHNLSLLLKRFVPVASTSRIKVHFEQVKFPLRIHEKVKSKELKTPFLVLQSMAVGNGLLNNLSWLLSIFSSQIFLGRSKKFLKHHDWGESRSFFLPVEMVVCQVYFSVQLVQCKFLVGKSTVSRMIFKGDDSIGVASD